MEETTLQNWALHQKENPEKSPKKLAYLPLRGTQGGWKSHPKETLRMQSRGFSRALRLLWLELTPTHPEEATGKAICKFCTKPRKIWYFFPQFRRGSRGTLQRVNKELGYGGFCPRNLSHATWVMRDEFVTLFIMYWYYLIICNWMDAGNIFAIHWKTVTPLVRDGHHISLFHTQPRLVSGRGHIF